MTADVWAVLETWSEGRESHRGGRFYGWVLLGQLVRGRPFRRPASTQSVTMMLTERAPVRNEGRGEEKQCSGEGRSHACQQGGCLLRALRGAPGKGGQVVSGIGGKARERAGARGVADFAVPPVDAAT